MILAGAARHTTVAPRPSAPTPLTTPHQPFAENILTIPSLFAIILRSNFISSGCSADGSAPGLGPGCRRFKSCHSDHMKIIRTFSYLESRSDYLFYLSIQILIVRNENSRYHGLLTMVSAFALLKNTQIYDIIKIISNQNPFSVT